MPKWNEYKTFSYDMDGTLLWNNGLKEAGFCEPINKLYGADAADAMRQIHRTAGSASRMQRIQQFMTTVLNRNDVTLMENLCTTVSWHIRELQRKYGMAMYGIYEHLKLVDARKIVITGAQQHECEEALTQASLLPHFDALHCSVRKMATIPILVELGEVELPAVYFGDTKEDIEAARAAGMDAVLITADAMWDTSTFIPDKNTWAFEDFDDVNNSMLDKN